MSEAAEETPSHDNVFDAAYLKVYSSYGGSEAKAARAIRGRCKGLDATEAKAALQKGIQLVEAATEIVKTETVSVAEFVENFSIDEAFTNLDWLGFDTGLHNRFPDFKLETVRSCMSFVLVHYVLR